MANPFAKYAPQGNGIGPDPYKVNEEKRKETASQLAQQAADRAAAQAAEANRNAAEARNLAEKKFMAELAQKGLMIGPDGQIVKDPKGPIGGTASTKPLRQGDGTILEADVNQYTSLKQMLGSFKDDYGGNLVGGLENTAQGAFSGIGTPGQRDWWSNFYNTDNVIRNSLYGASLTDGEKKAYEATTVSPSMDPNTIRENLARRAQLSQAILGRRVNRFKAAGYNPAEIDATLGFIGEDLTPEVLAKNPYANPNAKPEDNTPAGVLPDGGQGGGPRMPNMIGGLPEDTDIQFNFAKQGGGFDRNAWLMSNFGITPNQEAGITAFLKANRANPNFGYKDIAAFYKGIGAPVPEEDQRTIDLIRSGNVDITGYDSSQAEAAYQAELAQRVKERDTTGGAIDTFGRTASNALFGAGDRLAAGVDTLTDDGSYSENLARQRFESDAAREANPVPAFLGDVFGLTGGTVGTGRLANSLATRFVPGLARQGAAGSSFGRNVLNDAAYGGVYGATEGDGGAMGAITGGVGSTGVQLLGMGAAKGLQGAIMNPYAQRLRDLGVQSLTTGQMLGGKAKAFEDAMTSFPFVGDIVNARRSDGFQEFNRAALNEAGAPIGATINDTGENGLNTLMGRVGNAYDNATAGVNVPLDGQFKADMQAAAMAGKKLPPDYQMRFDKMGQNRIGPITDAAAMTGDTYQQAMRGLKAGRKSAAGAAPGFEEDYKGALTLSMDALRSQMERGGGQSVIDGLRAADTSNRLGKTIEKATTAARNGSRSGEVQIFTPSQLQDAGYATAAKYPGPRPFADLAELGQRVLPSQLPDSGTGRRVAQMLLPASLGGIGAGGGAALPGVDAQTGGASGLALGTLLALGGTKAGQKALEAALFKRPKAIRRASGIFGSRKGQQALGGAVTAPFLIE